MALSPMMQQYQNIKEQYPDTLLFYRLGDFYEMFFEDAILASRELELTLTGRDCGLEERAPMCGVPHHSVQQYIDRLTEKGYKVAICEQAEDPALAKGIVKRQVEQVITPGTTTSDGLLAEGENHYLCSVFGDEESCALAAADISTGDLYVAEAPRSGFLPMLTRYQPKEIVINTAWFSDEVLVGKMREICRCPVEGMADWCYEEEYVRQRIEKQFSCAPEHLPIGDKPCAIRAVGGLLEYLANTHMRALPNLRTMHYDSSDQFLELDMASRRNLEVVSTMRENKKRGSLLWAMDETKTGMGARMLRTWVEKPLRDCVKIHKRQDAVEELHHDTVLRDELRREMDSVLDMERLYCRITGASGNCRDLTALCQSLEALPRVKALISGLKTDMFLEIEAKLDPLERLCDVLKRGVDDNPPITVKEGGIIRDGFNEEVDRLRDALKNGKSWLIEMEAREREETGIKTLKIGFNRVFGYYIEVSKSQTGQVPDRYTRRQTLANGERYITPELKEIENSILGAEERLAQLEYSIFCDLRDRVTKAGDKILESAKQLATADAIASLAEVAVRENYVRPVVDEKNRISIRDGRHPVVEKMLRDSLFVPNDAYLSGEDRLSIITGPNMAGKSTYMRQVALIVLMAQVGSFVPASSAEIGITDQIFTRVGASDDLATGQSTFMLEMREVANILENATPKSLIILDEIGRGTSTFDGLAIAWAVAEYIADSKKLGAKTLFATHYHELTQLEERLEGVKNYCIAAKKRGDDIIFLRKIIRGGADDSYGIEVAKLAGVKNEVIRRAKKILEEIEKGEVQRPAPTVREEEPQMGFAGVAAAEIAVELEKIDLNVITPIEAMNELYRLKKKLM